jgi:hypothetical protein
MTMTNDYGPQSPLGDASVHYREKKNSNGGIVDNVEMGQLEIYPAGYSQPSRRDGGNRQKAHEKVYERAVQLGTHEELYPLKGECHNVVLVPEPDNPYDANAVRVVLQGTAGTPLEDVGGKELGYIPKRISALISRNIDRISRGKIMKVRSGFHNKYYTTKVAFLYGPREFQSSEEKDLTRFSDLFE